ncbi:hypothetical protein ACFYVL_44450 [Streptomyces sp. NPDC004111]|uniref:hypothetical protein n=1 Tax=Streptomyces sp. NPDC004111 TaxID=3364690 RepID=UPI0036C2164C
MGVARRLRRAGVVAALAALPLMLNPATAQAAGDWTDYTDLVPYMPDLPGFRDGSVDYAGGYVWAMIGWDGTKEVWLKAIAKDTAGDGKGIAMQIRYQSYRNGAWSGWQYRLPAKAGGLNKKDIKLYENDVPIKNVQFRGCYYTGTSTIVQCDGTWH